MASTSMRGTMSKRMNWMIKPTVFASKPRSAWLPSTKLFTNSAGYLNATLEGPRPRRLRSGDVADKPLITNPYIIYNEYKCRKVWPPDLSNMTVQQQLRFEKKYKRRVILATACVDWKRWVKIAQVVSIPTIVLYILLVAQFDDNFIPFYPLRKEVYSWFGVDIGPQHSGKGQFTFGKDRVWKQNR